MSDMDNTFDPVEDAIRAVANGEIVIVTDDRQRENEGDLVMAADAVTDESINFMTKYGRGLICVALRGDRVAQIGLSRMNLRGNGDAFCTAFLESVDAAEGITTGISAHDRAETVRTLVRDDVKGSDIVSPGHMFPLEAKDGGVLQRAGHTEASVDLARLAGRRAAGVICEILRDDGHMARLPELKTLASEHGLKMTCIADLIAYRRRIERLVKRVRSTSLPTKYGPFTLTLYESIIDKKHHVALVMGTWSAEDEVLVRVHSECLTGDVFGSLRCDCGLQFQAAAEMISKEGKGVILYMRQEGRGIGFENKIHAYALQDRGMDTVEANQHLGFDADLREYGVGAQVLCDLGLRKIRLLTNNPRKVIGLEGYGLEIVERVPLILPATEHSRRYLETKRRKLGHLL